MSSSASSAVKVNSKPTSTKTKGFKKPGPVADPYTLPDHVDPRMKNLFAKQLSKGMDLVVISTCGVHLAFNGVFTAEKFKTEYTEAFRTYFQQALERRDWIGGEVLDPFESYILRKVSLKSAKEYQDKVGSLWSQSILIHGPRDFDYYQKMWKPVRTPNLSPTGRTDLDLPRFPPGTYYIGDLAYVGDEDLVENKRDETDSEESEDAKPKPKKKRVKRSLAPGKTSPSTDPLVEFNTWNYSSATAYHCLTNGQQVANFTTAYGDTQILHTDMEPTFNPKNDRTLTPMICVDTGSIGICPVSLCSDKEIYSNLGVVRTYEESFHAYLDTTRHGVIVFGDLEVYTGDVTMKWEPVGDDKETKAQTSQADTDNKTME